VLIKVDKLGMKLMPQDAEGEKYAFPAFSSKKQNTRPFEKWPGVKKVKG